PGHVGRDAHNGFLVALGDAGGGTEGQSRRGAGSDQSSAATKLLRQISARRLMQLHQVDRFLRRKCDGGLDFVGHGRGGENRIGAGGVDERDDSEFFVVVRALGGAGRRGGRSGRSCVRT